MGRFLKEQGSNPKIVLNIAFDVYKLGFVFIFASYNIESDIKAHFLEYPPPQYEIGEGATVERFCSLFYIILIKKIKILPKSFHSNFLTPSNNQSPKASHPPAFTNFQLP